MTPCAQCAAPLSSEGYAGRGGARYCCFGCLSLGEQACAEACPPARGKLDGTAVRLGIGVLIVGQSMIFGLALNLHDDVPPAARELTQWLIFAGTALVSLLLGGPLLRTAASELRRGRLTIEALFLLTAAGALAASLQAHLTGRGKIYYEVVSVLLVVYTLGKLIGARARASALASARAWGDRLATARLMDEGGGTREVPVSEVQPGEVVEVRPGELIAVDGVIRTGFGFVAEAAVSGEPFAAVRRPGDRVLAGSACTDATLHVTATVRGTERQVDKLLAAVEAARDRPLSLQARADRLAVWFLPLVALTALGTFAYWAFFTAAGWEAGLFNAMSVLLVACPCVIGLATPVVIWSALNRLAERGVIVRSGDAIERLAAVDRVMFDKTGTLTDDHFALVDIETTATGTERAKLLGWLSLVQAQSSHPVAKPFAELPRPFAPGTEPRVVSFAVVPGCGVAAELAETDGTRHTIQVGTPAWLGTHGRLSQTNPREHIVHAAVDGELAAIATVTERLRDSTPQALAHFAQLELPVEVLTGDATGRAEALGLPPARARLLPEDKRRAIEEAEAGGGKTLFVGDGINDASALAAAHVGVALASGTDLAVSAAPVTLYGDDLRAIPWAVELSRDAVGAVRRNLLRALCYNLVGMSLAACGVLHPVVAAVLMVVSSLTLVYSSTRVGCHLGASLRVAPTAVAGPPVAMSLTARRTEAWAQTAALLHGVAFALQGFVLALLLKSSLVLPVAFLLAGAAIAFVWYRWPRLPHGADMCFGMLTLGNLGMLLGWWADNAFSPLVCAHCACTEPGKPWMWVGMLALANVAMLWLGRGPKPRGAHALAMFTGGNVGMVAGMLAGGMLAARLEIADLGPAVAATFVAMTLGMLLGMLAGTWLTERLIAGLHAVGFVPKQWRTGATRPYSSS